MIRGTTIPITITCADATFTAYTDIHVTFKQAEHVIDLTPSVVSDTELSVSMTQEQALQLVAPSAFPLKVQANWLWGGVRYATYVTNTKVYEQILGEVIG